MSTQEVPMMEIIGEMAGRIWEILGRNGGMNVSQLPKAVKEKDDIVYQALGWLAREGKVTFSRQNNKTLVALSDHECDVYKKSH